MTNINEDRTEEVIITEEAILIEDDKSSARKDAIKSGLIKFGVKVGVTVAVGVVSHLILKAILPDEEPALEAIETVDEIVIEEITEE